MSKDYKRCVYLAGPMEGQTQDEMTGWRNSASTSFKYAGIEVLDPTRRVSFHDQLDPSVSLDDVRNLNVCKRIFKQDLQDIHRSRVVLANTREGLSDRFIGSSMELMYAHMHNKIIILWADEDDKVHPFLEAIYTEKHFTLEEAIDAAIQYYD